MRILWIIFLFSYAQGAIISIPLDNSSFEQSPANDLVYKGERINEREAIKLAKQGIDLSDLNPYSSSLYQNEHIQKKEVDVPNERIYFHSSLKSPTEFYRAAINIQGENYILSASLYNHQTMMRAKILQLIGYQIELPRFQQKLRLYFHSLKEKELFIDSLTQATLLAQSRWIESKESQSNELFLDLKGVIIEPADLKAVPVYWPIMQVSRQKSRRVFRALSYLYTLTNFPQQINRIPWDFGKVFDEKLVLEHPYAPAFTHVTLADFKWMHNKIAALSESELSDAIHAAHYPPGIETVVFEKIKSRINRIAKLIGEKQHFNVNKNVSTLDVVDGELTHGNFPDYVPIFWENDPLSPYRFSEVFKLFRTQLTYDSISEALNKAMERFIPKIDTSDAMDNIMARLKDYYKKEGVIPLDMWSYPTFQGGVSGNRSIVFGQYLGNNAPIQLVDSIQYELGVGLFSYLSGIGKIGEISPIFSVNTKLARNFSHIRAMPDLSTATSQEVKKILIPKLMKKLGAVLNDKPQCSLDQEAWYTEEILSTFRTYVIYYNNENEYGKTAALKLRSELIDSGIPEDKIIFTPVSRTQLCEKEIQDLRSKSIEDFIKEFALDETFTITDSLSLGAKAGLRADLSGMDQLKAQMSLGRDKAILRSFSLRKISGGIEITLQTQNNLATSFAQGLKFYIDVMNNTSRWMQGKMISKVYKIMLENITDEQKKIAIHTLREILIRNSFSHLKEHYNPIELDHKADVFLNTFKFSWKKSERLFMNQELTLVVPNRAENLIIEEEHEDDWSIPSQPEVDLDLSDRTKKIFSAMSFKRSGSNFRNFLDRLLNDQFDWLNIGSSDRDPGNSLLGFSKKRYYFTETEMSENAPEQTMVKIEYAHTGWQAHHNKLESILKQHENYLNYSTDTNFTIARGQFQQMSSLKSYDIRTTIILYPSAIQKLKNLVTNAKESELYQLFRNIYGHREWKRYCERQASRSHYRRNREHCLPSKFRGLMKRRKNGFAKNKKTMTNQIHYMIGTLFEGNIKSQALNFIGKENFFASTYISGYREDDPDGFLIYTSDTVGTYQKDYGTGLFDHIAAQTGITPYLLRGMVYTPSM